MIASERRREILKLLNNKGVIALKDVAEVLSVSEITIRRDFEKLEAEGKLKRVQGGASIENGEAAELTMSQKLPIHMKEKEDIADFAATMVNDGDCVFIDGGTTFIPLVAKLARKNIRIITYSTLFFDKFKKSNAKLFMIGGEYLPYYNMNVGAITQDTIKQFYFDIAFFGCAGIDAIAQTVYTTESESLMIKKIAMINSKKNYLLADSYKFSMKGFLKICDTSDFDGIITNTFSPEKEIPGNVVMTPSREIKANK